MKLRHWISAALYALLAVILVATIIVAWIGSRDGTLRPLDLWAGVVPVIVAIVTVILGNLRSGRQRRLSLEEAAKEQVTALAEAVKVEWREEGRYRGLYEGRRMGLRWEVTPGSDLRSRLATALPGHGTLDQLTSGFGHHVRGGALTRLVVTGEVGAGKTAACVLLTLELDDQSPIVPVPFQLASWDPHTSLHEWMTDELLRNYPFLSDQGYGRQLAARLARHHMLPVLDGLDEVREPAAALQRVEEELAGRSFVLSCRTGEFAAANAGHVLHQALIVQLQPLRADEVRDYLLGYESGVGQGRLTPLVAALKDQPTGPVAAALRTPFMLSLAVAPGDPIPEDLLTLAGPDAADRIQRHLLGTFADKAYAQPPWREKDGISADEARHYLEFLARHVDPVTGRLAWWRLHLAVPRMVFQIAAVVIACVACSGLAAGFFAVFERPGLGFGIGLAAGIIGASVVELLPQEDPRRARPTLRSLPVSSQYTLLRSLGFGLTGGAACAVIVWFLYEPAHYLIIGGALSGLTFAMARYFSEPSDPMQAVTPDSLLRNDRVTVLYAWLAGGVSGALTGAYLGASLRDGRRTPDLDDVAIVTTLPPAVLALLGAIGGFGLSAAGLGLMVHGSSSWGRFITTRAWLAARGSAPLRLMTFLGEARRRGVLRQVNGYYEFRHRLLQRHLADPSPETSADPAGPPVASLTETTTGPGSTQ